MESGQSLLQTNPISAQVYASLKKDILEGTLQPGDRLLVLDIAGKFQISQAPVREALERLKHEGLIVSKPNKGSVVSDITHKEIRDIFVLREIIEGFAVRESVPTMKEEDFQYLHDVLTRLDKAVKQNDILQILEIDMEFHGFFYKRCGNQAILELWQHMKTKVMRFMAISNRYHSTEKLVEGHLALIESIRTGSIAHVEKSFIEHMKSYKWILN
ncbi:GntR family transcriptional regulator [Paenibacillus thermotolerans]|uniref:GntR family transcriptional regulator n=1 Tax=Paenibacillus thermotolerans TaxID=3027807 RepID=UPI0023684915|nr:MULTISPECIES: GntR family transcriptional regulator [unclassified Paenibacillus]